MKASLSASDHASCLVSSDLRSLVAHYEAQRNNPILTLKKGEETQPRLAFAELDTLVFLEIPPSRFITLV